MIARQDHNASDRLNSYFYVLVAIINEALFCSFWLARKLIVQWWLVKSRAYGGSAIKSQLLVLQINYTQRKHNNNLHRGIYDFKLDLPAF